MNEWERRWKLGYELRENEGGGCIHVELAYPSIGKVLNKVEVGLTDVRAADSIRIFYDFKRDGWVVQQASIFSWASDDLVFDQDWQEVAFIQAWGRRVPTKFDDDYEEVEKK